MYMTHSDSASYERTEGQNLDENLFQHQQENDVHGWQMNTESQSNSDAVSANISSIGYNRQKITDT